VGSIIENQMKYMQIKKLIIHRISFWFLGGFYRLKMKSSLGATENSWSYILRKTIKVEVF
jgi:hypothetical protein